ncbi:GlxA family transcriptional regulator [Nocardioides iriomotensis]|uniref:Helix-turn-helix domain-containing protein n=1 Tax=Nocardioides iriomotensis TaxID=715784 RepID=A0A4Q5IY80_9ACTN|nr:DJ-1/PfpI family protein [Nocardioides iriomotensis]RYU10198.1 helix-turn-helix domain-containing protein [Nocardioides iriomotensis]
MTSPAVTFVIFDGFDALDLAGPFEVFGEAGYELAVVAPTAGPIRSDTGLTIQADSSVASLDPSLRGTLLVVGGEDVPEARYDRSVVDWVATAAGRTDRVASVCTGAFILAEAGLLDGRHATTHWREAERLAREYPAVIVDRDPIFIQDGRIWTSAGVTAGMDLALALVEADLGPQTALDVARELVMFLRRPGSQSQFSVPLWSTQPESDVMRRVVESIHLDPGVGHGIDDLASLAGLSPRHLQRRFTQETGLTPAVYVERVRVEAAQRALAERDDPLETIARRYGFGTAETLRRTFHRLVGIAPSEYRDRFRTTTSIARHAASEASRPAQPAHLERISS